MYATDIVLYTLCLHNDEYLLLLEAEVLSLHGLEGAECCHLTQHLSTAALLIVAFIWSGIPQTERERERIQLRKAMAVVLFFITC